MLGLHQECPEVVKLVMGLHHESSGMVELVYGLHHVSYGGDQEKFLSGEASAWASPREFKGGGAKA